MLKLVETDLSRLLKKKQSESQLLQTTVNSLIGDIDKLISEIDSSQSCQSMQNEIACTGPTLLEITRPGCEEIVRRKYVAGIQAVHRDYFVYISRLGKAIEKTLQPEINSPALYRPLDKQQMAELILEHQSQTQLLSQEPDQQDHTAIVLARLQRLLRKNEVESAFGVLQDHRCEAIEGIHALKTGVYKMYFLQLAKDKKIIEGIAFLRKNYPKQSLRDIEEMGQLLHIHTFKDEELVPRRLRKHRYHRIWSQTMRTIQRMIRKRHGLKENSNLKEIIVAGLIALPEFLSNLKTLEQDNGSLELPVSVRLPSEMLHHSMVCCPISREICQAPHNPAVILDCGHIVGESSVTKMMELEIQKGKLTFKCPTCPNEQIVANLKAISY